MNVDSSDASSVWYYWVTYVRGEEQLQEQTSTTPEMRSAIIGRICEQADERLEEG
jgi:hypothetical protein